MNWKEGIISSPGFVLLERGPMPVEPWQEHYDYAPDYYAARNTYNVALVEWEYRGTPIEIAKELLTIKVGDMVGVNLVLFEADKDRLFEVTFKRYNYVTVAQDTYSWGIYKKNVVKFPTGTKVQVIVKDNKVTDIKLK